MNQSAIGKHFIVGLTGTKLSAEEATLLRRLSPTGVILFAHNVDATSSPKWPALLSEMLAAVRDAIGREQLIVSIDHEGGKVHRLPPPVSHFPPAANWRGRAREVGRAMGRELRALGINLNFAPVADVLSNPANKVIGERAFGSTPEEVRKEAVQFFRGLEEEGVLACAKHFPGHGRTVEDSHFELPALSCTREQIDQCELPPFEALIQSGIRLIMTAHVVFSALDPQQPATVSPTIIRKLLRSHLGYSGAVISDAVEMNALQAIPTGEVGCSILRASADLILVGKPQGVVPCQRALEMAQGIADALDQGSLNEALVRDSNQRINALLEHGRAIRNSAKTADAECLSCDAHVALCNDLNRLT